MVIRREELRLIDGNPPVASISEYAVHFSRTQVYQLFSRFRVLLEPRHVKGPRDLATPSARTLVRLVMNDGQAVVDRGANIGFTARAEDWQSLRVGIEEQDFVGRQRYATRG